MDSHFGPHNMRSAQRQQESIRLIKELLRNIKERDKYVQQGGQSLTTRHRRSSSLPDLSSLSAAVSVHERSNPETLYFANIVDKDLLQVAFQSYLESKAMKLPEGVGDRLPPKLRKIVYHHCWMGFDFTIHLDLKTTRHWNHLRHGAFDPATCKSTMPHWLVEEIVGTRFSTEAAHYFYKHVDYQGVPLSQLSDFLAHDHFHLRMLLPHKHLTRVEIDVSADDFPGLSSASSGNLSKNALKYVNQLRDLIYLELESGFSLVVRLGRGCEGRAMESVLARWTKVVPRLRGRGIEVGIYGMVNGRETGNLVDYYEMGLDEWQGRHGIGEKVVRVEIDTLD